jgi:hypothetical protein
LYEFCCKRDGRKCRCPNARGLVLAVPVCADQDLADVCRCDTATVVRRGSCACSVAFADFTGAGRMRGRWVRMRSHFLQVQRAEHAAVRGGVRTTSAGTAATPVRFWSCTVPRYPRVSSLAISRQWRAQSFRFRPLAGCRGTLEAATPRRDRMAKGPQRQDPLNAV